MCWMPTWSINRIGGRSFFEFGLGGTLVAGKADHPYILYPIVGYRFLPVEPNKLSFRVFGHVPFSEAAAKGVTFIPIGLSVGLGF